MIIDNQWIAMPSLAKDDCTFELKFKFKAGCFVNKNEVDNHCVNEI